MRITRAIEKTVVETTDILCNRCGESCKGDLNFNGLIEAQVVGAYDSTSLLDNVIYTFSMCEKCLSEMFRYFAHQPQETTASPSD